MSLIKIKLIKHAVFDAYGTLFDINSAVLNYKEKLGEKANLVSDQWRMKQLEYMWLRSLMGIYDNFSQVTKEALEFTFDSNNIKNNDLKEKLLNTYNKLSCYSEVPKFLECIRNKGVGMSVLSNGTHAMLHEVIKNCSLTKYFDSIFSADNVRVFKPDPKVYKMTVDKLECDPIEILFFSSNSWDISGASSFGYQTVWVNRFSQKKERLPGQPLLEVKNLMDVLDYLN